VYEDDGEQIMQEQISLSEMVDTLPKIEVDVESDLQQGICIPTLTMN
jgi:hypothetical protein